MPLSRSRDAWERLTFVFYAHVQVRTSLSVTSLTQDKINEDCFIGLEVAALLEAIPFPSFEIASYTLKGVVVVQV